MAESDDARWLRTCLGEIGEMNVDAPTLRRLIHAPLARIRPDRSLSTVERGTPTTPQETRPLDGTAIHGQERKL
jgi:hypothetical protein